MILGCLLHSILVLKLPIASKVSATKVLSDRDCMRGSREDYERTREWPKTIRYNRIHGR